MSSFIDKMTLLKRLLDAARECQTQYSTKQEIMTEKSSFVSCVCHQFEDVLSHGIRQRPIVSGIATIQNVTGLQFIDQDIVFWHCIQKHLSKHEVERFNSLYHITTDLGKGRAWLRSSLNEHSLERIFQILLSDPDTLKQHYSDDAFLLDDEKSSLLPQIAGGLKTVMFSIRIDDPALNCYPQGSANSQSQKRSNSGGTRFTLPSLSQVSSILGHEVAMDNFPEAALQPVGSSPKSEHRQKKRKKKAKTKIINFGLSGERVLELGSSLYSIDDNVATKERLSNSSPNFSPQKCSAKSLPNSQRCEIKTYPQPISAKEEIQIQSSSQVTGHAVVQSNFSVGEVPKDINSGMSLLDEETASLINMEEIALSMEACEKKHDMNLTIGRPSGSIFNLNPSMVESFSGSKIADKLESSLHLKFDSNSDLSSLNDGDAKSTVSTSSSNQFESNYAMYPEFSGTSLTPLNDNDSVPSSSGSLSNETLFGNERLVCNTDSPRIASVSPEMVEEKNSYEKNGDLQKALVVLLQRKDELVEENKVLKELLKAEKQHSSLLKEKNDQLKSKVEDMEHTTQVDSRKQSRENDVLRNQLKKYVGAVRALQYGKVPGVSQEGIPGMGGESENLSQDKNAEDGEAKAYEQKLIEVTEMHGELMEFTESLHTRFLSALALIHKMHDELIALRGPMPTDNVIRTIESDKPRRDMSTLPSVTRALVNVWVPSAFMQGSGPDSHHVYQVYICMEDVEWNVYRRYSDFHGLHSNLCKLYPEIQNFGFPPKKGIGNRNSKFVEERRKAFQKYLRLVMHNIFQNNVQLKACPTKETLLHILPFFSDAGDQFRVIVGKHKK